MRVEPTNDVTCDKQGERLVEFFSELLGAITNCISDTDPVVRERAGEANKDLLELVQVIRFCAMICYAQTSVHGVWWRVGLDPVGLVAAVIGVCSCSRLVAVPVRCAPRWLR